MNSFLKLAALCSLALFTNACGEAVAAEGDSVTGDAAQQTQEIQASLGAKQLQGTWAGSASGTFGGQPFAFVGTFAVTAPNNHTINGTLSLDTTVGPLTATCTAPYDPATQSAVATCQGSNGLTTIVHIVITDGGREVRFWENVTEIGLFATGSLRRQ